jgi:hypothetical protein
MGIIKKPHPVKLFIGMISGDTRLLEEIEDILVKEFGEIDMRSPVWRWDHTDYYQEEMGSNLMRKFVFFDTLIDPGRIAEIKIRTNEIEGLYVNERGGRKINLDPGYLELSKIVLVTTKNYSHRVYLRDGIYAEVTLIFKKGEYQPLPYTYRDYASPEYRELFKMAREIYHQKIKFK